MSFVTCKERDFAIVISAAGMPGLRFDHPNLVINAESEEPAVVAALEALSETAEALWAIMEEQGLLAKLEPLMKQAVEVVSTQQDSRVDRVKRAAVSAGKALDAWPATQPDMSAPQYIRAFGAQLLDSGQERERVSTRAVIG